MTEKPVYQQSPCCRGCFGRIDGAPFGRCHQPRAGIFGEAFFGLEFERSHQGVLGQFFCDADVVGTRAMAAMSRVDSIFQTASIALGSSFMPARLRRSGIH
jgi:hypothetical protein